LISGTSDVPDGSDAPYSELVHHSSVLMTSISLTSGELLDVISALCDKEQALYDAEDLHLSAYYLNILQQFEQIVEKLEEKPGENRVAHLVLAA
jgi:hypothetical protein